MQKLTRARDCEARDGPEKVSTETGSVKLTLVTPVAIEKQFTLYRAAEARRSAKV